MTDDSAADPPRLTRRTALQRLAAGSAAMLAAALPRTARSAEAPTGGACVVRPRHIEGPYFIDAALNRSDIRSDPRTGVMKPGVPVRLTFRVSQLAGARCLPLASARVHLWQCDANGLYSDTDDWQASTVGQRFLRGYQVTDKKGVASFTTIFPGWYPNRAVHIHFKIRTGGSGKISSEFTSQIYFEDDVIDLIHAHPAYAEHGPRKVRNHHDLLFLFRGSQLVLPLREEKKGYAGTFDIALDL